MSGVPRGSVLDSLLLVLLFVNYLPSYVNYKCMFFADYLKIYFNIRHSNIIDMSSNLSSCQRDIYIYVAHKKSFIKRLDLAQVGSYYVR